LSRAVLGELIERRSELATIRQLLGQVRAGAGAIALVEGSPGVGKTSLIAVATEIAREQGLAVAKARGSELERDFAFGVVRQLYEPLLDDLPDAKRNEVFAGAAGLARRLVESREPESPDARLEPHAALHGLYWLTVNLAAVSPLVLAIDDLQWADPSSLRFVAYLANRIETLPLLAVVGTRTDESGAHTEVIDELSANPMTARLQPGPLSHDGVSQLVGRILGDAHPAFSARCYDATKGNPLLLNELATTLAAAGVEPKAEHARRVDELAPGSVARWVARRLRRMPLAATSVARSLAVLGDRTDVATVAALADIDPAEAATGIGALQRSDIIETAALRFTHPVVRAAVYEQLPSLERARLHRAAARLLAAGLADDADVALHLRNAEPEGDAWSVEVLRRAAHQAYFDGAPEMAVGHLERALAEPPLPETRSQVLVELGRAKLADVHLIGFEHLRAAIVQAPDNVARARLGLELGRALSAWLMFDEAVSVLQRAREEVGGEQSPLSAQLDGALFNARLPDPSLRADWDVEAILDLFLHSERVSDPPMLAALAVAGSTRVAPAARAVSIAERAFADEHFSFVEAPLEMAMATFALVHADRLERALQIWDGVLRDGRSRGSPVTLGFAESMRALLFLRVGEVARAESLARYRLGVVTDRSGEQLTGVHISVLPFILLALTEALLERGELDEAARLLENHGFNGPLPDIFGLNHLLEARGRLRLAQNFVDEGIADVRECGRRLDADNFTNPAVVAWRATLAVALAAAGHRAEARELADAEVAAARLFEVPRELGMALRARGLVQGGSEGIESLREAVAVLEASPARLEHARALTDLGAALRREGRRQEAREPLRVGVELAQRCGATALTRRAHDELVAAGARPRRLIVSGIGALTASERRVADLAADGLTNREIAQALFVTEKTVEGHLGHTYLKLGVKSRSQLPDLLGEQSQAIAT
jgi:DNA-binding CsgD family transcriptional regulator